MPAESSVPPTPELAQLAEILGLDDTRDLVRTFLSEFETIRHGLQEGPRGKQHRLAHALKSSARHMGAKDLSAYAAELELRLEARDGTITPADLQAITVAFEQQAPALRNFVGKG
jgi:HPt (histidine-containing phosphotransfer) domain-containing protein